MNKMSDKSFGDYTNRNLLKNPLLSTAVTGLSIEDLTQNAVLLPVVRNQGLVPGQDPCVNQTQSLPHLELDAPRLPSGDANFNTLPAKPQPVDNSFSKNTQETIIKNDKPIEPPSVSVSKASVRSEDDFDVNEYFARLQGTRYVSAPVNSIHKDDPNANLEATEENLEEINLNEPEKQYDDNQQSITADIAQNFSQLPTVLPQVASAVFSSFSNMLNYKSREHTPEESKVKDAVHQEVQVHRPVEESVTLMGVSSAEKAKEVAPPPREPPATVVGSYRITTKKKAYAQLPGLSTRDESQNFSVFSPLVNPSNTPSYFVPPLSNIQENIPPTHTFSDLEDLSAGESGVQDASYSMLNATSLTEERASDNKPCASVEVKFTASESIAQENKHIEITSQIVSDTSQPPYSQSSNSCVFYDATPRNSNPSIIPPPPMFAMLENIANKDTQSVNKERTILPPSVSRRISTRQPVLKTIAPTVIPMLPDNIFIPKPINNEVDPIASGTQQTMPPMFDQSNSVAQPVSTFQPNVMAMPTGTEKVIIESGNTSCVSSPLFTTYSKSSGSEPQKIIFEDSPTPALPPKASSNMPVNSAPNLPLQSSFTSPQPSNIQQWPTSPVQESFSYVDLSNVPQASTINTNNSQSVPKFFNPNTIPSQIEPLAKQEDRNLLTDPYLKRTEPIKPIGEPPKITSGHVNYRMPKKRPQYYAGPIEGVGTLSNNVKPVLPPVLIGALPSAVLTPDQKTQSEKYSATNMQTVTVPFNVLKPGENMANYNRLEENKLENTFPSKPDYDTVFDLSRQTTEYIQPTTEEPKGFGIIGSLKSKLTSIDINKIQQNVTTFFDPAYNDVKKDKKNAQEHVSSDHHATDAPVNTGGNLEIFVPNMQQDQPTSHQYHGNLPSNRNYTYNYLQETSSYQNQDPYQYQSTQPYVFTSYYSDVSAQSQPVYTNPIHDTVQTMHNKLNPEPTSLASDDKCMEKNVKESDKDQYPQYIGRADLLEKHALVTQCTDTQLDTEAIETSKVVSNPEISDDKISVGKTVAHKMVNYDEYPEFDMSTFKVKFDQILNIANKPKPTKPSSSSMANFFMEAPDMSFWSSNQDDEQNFLSGTYHIDHAFDSPLTDKNVLDDLDKVLDDKLQESFSPDEKKMHNLPICQPCLPSEEADDPLKDLEKEMNQIILSDSGNENSTVYFKGNDVKFFDKDLIVKNALIDQSCDSENISEFNICETCREVSKPDDKEPEDLTSQLIENITAPIQLLNPVEVPLTENVLDTEVTTDIDVINSLDEISHITEETIETINIQSATELLDGIPTTSRPFGWSTESNSGFPNTTGFLDHSYSISVNPDIKSTSFFQDTSIFFDNLPNNASDEIKAELKHTHEESPVILPRQMSIPSAPPAEDLDETKSDEGGVIDVLSIEQDANKDFPIFEEYVIEPSETDDDKIEYLEREKSDDSLQDKEKDTFTGRVEKFKQMEEIVDENKTSDQANLQNVNLTETTSPVISMASYFDTGNYAAETHYRNYLSSTSPTKFILGTSNSNKQMRIPPGFEDDYTANQSTLSGHDLTADSSNENIPNIPDTSTQTRPSNTFTFASSENLKPLDTALTSISLPSDSSLHETFSQSQKLPDFASVFGSLRRKSLEASIKEPLPASPIQKSPIKEETSTTSFPVDIKNLPDPINFFSSTLDSSTSQQTSADESGFNRLASYFASPTKTDNTKPFFELSQSQDHYRHTEPKQNLTLDDTNKDIGLETKIQEHKDFFDLSQSENHYMDPDTRLTNIRNIPQDTYIANLNLMKELSSYSVDYSPKEEIVRTVNYFSVQYDFDTNDTIKTDINIGEPEKLKADSERATKDNLKHGEFSESNEPEEMKDDLDLDKIVGHCAYCCNFNTGVVVNVGKVELDSVIKGKKAMDRQNESRSKKECSMDVQSRGGAKKSVNLNFEDVLQEENRDNVNTMFENRSSSEYSPVKHHWFYRVDCEGKSMWRGFSVMDSNALERAYSSPDLNENTLVATDGGRYDVNIHGRLRLPVYWSEKPTNVQRCSWFYKGTTDARYVPYTEVVAEKLEEEYRRGITTGEWHRRLSLGNSELVVMHGPAVMVHFMNGANDAFTTANQSTSRPRVVRRGHDESEIEDPEPSSIDHLLLLCHGVGSACDMRFRSVEEVVDDFRATSLQLIQSHYRNSYDTGAVGRIEVLPVSWHATLHSGEAGVDRRLAQITLDSIPRLRNFTNDTVLDVLFYTSPVFCQTIIDTVCKELNRIHALFRARNPRFAGGVSLGGHSLGSVILYDLLCHQSAAMVKSGAGGPLDKRYVSGSAGTGQPAVRYPSLDFAPAALYALGSPIAIFECIRGVESLGERFALPTCPKFFNIFHPYDPIAYRIEPLINPELRNVKPFLIPHHKGRKRMHLELKDTMVRVGADLKQKLMESIRATWSSVWRTQPPSNGHLEKVMEEELEKQELTDESGEINENSEPAAAGLLGALNGGRRVDYVLQEAPFEMINEYLFAMSSHVCYWESEDTMLLMLREIYDALGVRPDCSVPQHTLSVQRTRPAKEDTVVITTERASTSRGGSL